MTARINKVSAKVTVKGDQVTLKVADQELTLPVEAVTSAVTALLAGRKEATTNVRNIRQAKDAKAKAEREAKATAKKAERAAKAEQRVKDLKERLAAAEAKLAA